MFGVRGGVLVTQITIGQISHFGQSRGPWSNRRFRELRVDPHPVCFCSTEEIHSNWWARETFSGSALAEDKGRWGAVVERRPRKCRG